MNAQLRYDNGMGKVAPHFGKRHNWKSSDTPSSFSNREDFASVGRYCAMKNIPVGFKAWLVTAATLVLVPVAFQPVFGQEPDAVNRTRSHNLDFLKGSNLEIGDMAQRLGLAKEIAELQDLYGQVMKDAGKSSDPETAKASEKITESIRNGRLKVDPNDPRMNELRGRIERAGIS